MVGLDMGQGKLRDAAQGFKDAGAVLGNGLETGKALRVEFGIQHVHRHDVLQIALVPLEHHGDIPQGQPQFLEVVTEVLEAFLVGVEHRDLAVRHEHDAIHPLQHQLPGGVVEDLPRHGVQLELGLEATHQPHVDGEQIKEEGPVRFSIQGYHFTPGLLGSPGVNGIKVCGFATKTWTIINDFNRHLASCVIEKHHR